MTKGMTTRAKSIDDHLAKISSQLTDHDSRFDSLHKTIQKHSDHLDTMQKTIASHQTIIHELLLKLQKTDKQPILPTSSTPLPHPPYSPGSSAPSPTIQPRLPKLEIPLFSGDNVLGWLFQIGHFFQFHNIPPDQMLSIAAFYMMGPALQWYHWMHSTSQLSTWDTFNRQLELCFGPSSFINHEAQLYKLKQTTTVAAYLSDFEALSTRITGLSPTNLLNCFLSGLCEDIQQELSLMPPRSLHDAMGMAKLVEDKCNAHAFPFQTGSY